MSILLNKITFAQQQLANWNKTNRVEENYAKFFNWTILRRQNKAINLAEIEQLAQQCPQTDGNVVFAAQNLYNAITNKHRLFATSCDYKPSTNSKQASKLPIATLEEKNSIKVYPNPASTVVNISGNNIKGVELFDVHGKLLVTRKGSVGNIALPLSNLANGMYLLKVTDSNNRVTTQKFFKYQ